MDEVYFSLLNESHCSVLRNFDCGETISELDDKYSSKERRLIRKNNEEMNRFIRNEAFREQCAHLSTTHLMFHDDLNELIGFVSLCNDCIPIDENEKRRYSVNYKVVPAVKIARIGVSNKFIHQGYGTRLMYYALYAINRLIQISGAAFVTIDCYKYRVGFYEKFGFELNGIKNLSQVPSNSTVSMRISVQKWLESF